MKQRVAFASLFEKVKNSFLGTKQITGVYFWSAAYFVNTVGADKAAIKKDIRDQGALEKRQGKLA